MTAAELRQARQKMDMSLEAFARELGYEGRLDTVVRRIRRLESGSMKIPPATAARVSDAVARFERLRRLRMPT